MAPNVAKVDADRQLCLGTLPGYFRDEVLRWLLHGNSLLLLRRTCSSHLRGPIRWCFNDQSAQEIRRYWDSQLCQQHRAN